MKLFLTFFIYFDLGLAMPFRLHTLVYVAPVLCQSPIHPLRGFKPCGLCRSEVLYLAD